MAAEYKQLLNHMTGAISDVVLRVSDQTYIPPDPGNPDRATYEAWLAGGNTPDPPDPRPPFGDAP